jgi:hypothetical protein
MLTLWRRHSVRLIYLWRCKALTLQRQSVRLIYLCSCHHLWRCIAPLNCLLLLLSHPGYFFRVYYIVRCIWIDHLAAYIVLHRIIIKRRSILIDLLAMYTCICVVVIRMCFPVGTQPQKWSFLLFYFFAQNQIKLILIRWFYVYWVCYNRNMTIFYRLSFSVIGVYWCVTKTWTRLALKLSNGIYKKIEFISISNCAL